jgi:hypothetical protein
MSLINDALKRAKNAQEQKPPGGPPVAPLQPVDYTARPNWLFRSVVSLLLLASLTCSAWFFGKWWTSNRDSERVVAFAREAPAERPSKTGDPAQTPAPESAIKVSTSIIVRTDFDSAPRSEPEAVTQAPSTNAPLSAPPVNRIVPETNPAVPAPPPSPFADVKLQSIIYRQDKPAALINGEMVFVGEEVRGARVLKIDRQSVTVERKGETNELRLPRL